MNWLFKTQFSKSQETSQYVYTAYTVYYTNLHDGRKVEVYRYWCLALRHARTSRLSDRRRWQRRRADRHSKELVVAQTPNLRLE